MIHIFKKRHRSEIERCYSLLKNYIQYFDIEDTEGRFETQRDGSIVLTKTVYNSIHQTVLRRTPASSVTALPLGESFDTKQKTAVLD